MAQWGGPPPSPPKPPKPCFCNVFQRFRAGEPLEKVPRDHTDPYGSIRVHTDPYGPLSDQFSIFVGTAFGQHSEKTQKNNSKKYQLFSWKPKLFLFQFCAGCTEYQILGTSFWWFREHFKFADFGGFPGGSNLCASRRRTLRGLFFAEESVLKMRNSGHPGI